MTLLLFSDVQGNLAALQAVLAHPEAHRADALVCLGDVASGPSPGEVVDLLRARGAVCLRGNMDEVVAAPPAPDAFAGDARRFAELDTWCAARLSAEERGWLAALPLAARLELPGGLELLAVHGSPRSNDDALGPTTPDAEVRTALAGAGADVVAVGHLHEPMLRRLDDTLLLHPGSVGWPPPSPSGRRPLRAEFAVLESVAGALRVAFHALPYSTAGLRRTVLGSGMPHADWYLGLWQVD